MAHMAHMARMARDTSKEEWPWLLDGTTPKPATKTPPSHTIQTGSLYCPARLQVSGIHNENQDRSLHITESTVGLR